VTAPDVSDPLSSDRRSQVSVFVPAAQAAICADAECGGVFLAVNGKCPGCGSSMWVLMEPSAWVRENMERAMTSTQEEGGR
jgi:hypothetical protein